MKKLLVGIIIGALLPLSVSYARTIKLRKRGKKMMGAIHKDVWLYSGESFTVSWTGKNAQKHSLVVPLKKSALVVVDVNVTVK